MIDMVRSGKFSRSPSKIWYVFELLDLYLGDYLASCYTFQELGMICIWMSRFEVWFVYNVSW